MKVFLLLLAICSCLGHQCYRSVKTYIAECEIPNTLDSEYCKNKRQEAINGGCAQEIKDFDICKDDLRKLCSPDRENPKGCFGRCLMNKLPLLSSECANTETVKRILERIKSGRFPNPPVPENGGDSPNTPYPPQPNDPRPEGPPRQGGEQPPRPDGEQPPRPIGDHQPRPDGEQPQPPRSGEQPPRPNEELPAPEEQPEPSRVDPVPKVENPVDNKLGNRPGIGRGHNRHEVKHSESEAEWRNGMRGPHRWNKFHRRCGRKVILASIVASLLFTVGLCWTIRERQRRAFLRRSRVTTTKAPGSWSTGLFGSWDQIAPDWKTCLPSFLFPCFQNALNQSELQDRDCTFADFFFNIASWQRQSNTYRDRQEIRARHNIPEDSCGDCLAAVFCNPCAVAQNAREIDIRTCAQGGTYWPAQKLPDTWVPAAKADIV